MENLVQAISDPFRETADFGAAIEFPEDSIPLCREPLLQETSGYEAAEKLLASGADFDAIFAASDLIAFGAVNCLSKHGVAVPEQVSVVGFDDVPAASYFTPALTTVRQDTLRAAEGLVDGLLHMISASFGYLLISSRHPWSSGIPAGATPAESRPASVREAGQAARYKALSANRAHCAIDGADPTCVPSNAIGAIPSLPC